MNRSDGLTTPLRTRAGFYLVGCVLAYLALLIAGGSKVSAAFHIPHDSAEKAIAFVTQNDWAIRWGSFCELTSAIVLGVFMAAIISRLRSLEPSAAGESIASLGAIGATLMLMFSAMATWSLTRPGIAEATGAVRALQALGFIGGGPGFAVPLGLFIAGVSLSAGRQKLMPRWLLWMGIGVAIACELSALTLLNFKAGYFIPVGRFLSIIWMLGVSLTLPTISKPVHDGVLISAH